MNINVKGVKVQGSPSPFFWVSMTVCQYSFNPLGGKRCYKGKYNINKHHTKTQSGFALVLSIQSPQG